MHRVCVELLEKMFNVTLKVASHISLRTNPLGAKRTSQKPCRFSSDLLSKFPFITLLDLNAVARGKRLALNYYQRFMHANPALDCTIGSLNDNRGLKHET